MHVIKNPNFEVSIISLDLDDTLWPVEPIIAAAEHNFYRQLQADYARITEAVDADQLRLQRMAYMRSRPHMHHDLTQLRIRFIDDLLLQHGYPVDSERRLMTQFQIDRNQVDFYPGTLEALEHLAKRYKLVACTNGNADVFKTAAAEFFSASISSENTGAAKPDKRIFDKLCQDMGCRAPDVLHLGDNPQTDTLGALHAGMHSVWFNRDQVQWPHPQQPHAAVASLDELINLLEAR